MSILAGTSGADSLLGGSEDDVLTGYEGNDTLFGDSGSNTLYGGDDDDVLTSGAGADSLFGDAGMDTLTAGEGNDSLDGGDGDDVLAGGLGADTMTGGAGDDLYVFGFGIPRSESSPSTIDVITDFEGAGAAGGDLIDLPAFNSNLLLAFNVAESNFNFVGPEVESGVQLSPDLVGDGFVDVSWKYNAEENRVEVWVDANDDGQFSEVDMMIYLNGVTTFSVDDLADNFYAWRGTAGNDTYAGNANANTVFGVNGNDSLDGGAGNDSLYGGAGDDTADGDTGNDYLYGQAGDDSLSGGAGSDNLYGDIGNDMLSGGDSNDWIEGGAGNDTINGDAGDDMITDGDGANVIDAGDGNDYIFGSTGTLSAGLGNDSIQGAGTLNGDDGDDTLNALPVGYGLGTSVLSGGAGNDTLTGGLSLSGGAGDDALYIGSADEIQSGSPYAQTASGGSGADLFGISLSSRGSVRDTISDFNSTEGDRLTIDFVGNGTTLPHTPYFLNSSYWGVGQYVSLLWRGHMDASALVYGAALPGGDIGMGLVQAWYTNIGDTLYLVLDANGDLVFDANDMVVEFNGTSQTTLSVSDFVDGIFVAVAGTQDADSLVGTSGDDQIYGVAGDDTIAGNDGIDSVHGGLGNDSISGGLGIDGLAGDEGNDALDGGAGNDSLYGGAGDDTADGDTGNDYLYGQAGDDSLSGGAGSDNLYGDIGNDMLSGGDSNDWIEGGAGNDTINGDAGDDMITDGDGANVIDAGDGNDYIFGSTGTLSAGLGNDSIQGAGTLNGDDGDDALNALPVGYGLGTSVLSGGAGNDTLTGGLSLSGGAGDDALYIGSADEIQSGSPYAQTASGGSGADLFGISLSSRGSVRDTISDFNSTEGDRLTIDFVGNGTTLPYRNSNAYWGVGAYVSLLWRGHMDASALVYGEALPGGDIGMGLVQAWYTNIGDTLYLVLDANGDLVFDANDMVVEFNGTSQTTLSVSDFVDGIFVAVAGTQDADSLVGTSGDDQIYGVAGDDTIAGNDGIDSVHGGLGNDSISGGLGIDGLAGDEGNDALDGGAGNDSLYGGAGDDTADGDTGNDYLYGQAGDDSLSGGAGSDNLYGDIGNDMLSGGDSSDWIEGGAGNDTINGDAGDDMITDGDGANVIDAGDGNDYIFGSTGTLSGGLGNDSIQGAGTLNGDDGDDTLNALPVGYGLGTSVLSGGAGNDTLTGGLSLSGGAGDDALYIGSADEIQSGSPYAQTASGGSGADLFGISLSSRGSVRDTISDFNSTEGDRLTIDFVGNGTTLPYRNSNAYWGVGAYVSLLWRGHMDASALVYGEALPGGDIGMGLVQAWYTNIGDTLYLVLDANGDLVFDANDMVVEFNGTSQTTLSVSDFVDGIFLASAGTQGADSLVGTSGDDQIYGLAGDDTIAGNDGIDSVHGGLGNDSISGGLGNDGLAGDEGDDTLSGGVGHDSLYGGAGQDMLNGGDDADSLTGDAGDDTLNGDFGNDALYGNAGADLLNGGADNDTLDGGQDNDVLMGGDGNDTLYGGAGDDTLQGGSGDDHLEGDDGLNTASYANAQGAVSVSLAVSGAQDTGGAGTDDLSNIQGLIGSDFGDSLTGNAGDNVLDGGAGVDTLVGGIGNDTYLVDSSSDVIIEISGQGSDIIQAAFSFTLSDNVEGLVLTGTANINATGNDAANSLSGNAGNNVLDGQGGADTLAGGLGNDTYIVDNAGDSVVELTGQGVDVVQTANTVTLFANLENLLLLGSANINGTGNSADNQLTGNSGNNVLSGLTGNDVLDGGLGADSLLGGVGNDTYIVDDAADVVTELGGQGADTVMASVSYVLGSSVESLILTGSANIDATGNSNNNTLTGNDGNNSLDGKAGADTMTGGAGDDTYYVSDASDRVVEGDVTGIDTVFTSISYSAAGQYVENLTLTGSDNLSLLGNGVNNILRGNAGNNDLNGSVGADTMIGGAGSDTYTVDNTGDVVTETGSPGVDVVNSKVSFDIGAQYIEIVNLTGTANVNAYGSTSGRAESLTGNSGNNLLDGRTGADTMTGGLGNDTYVFDNAGDLIVENSDEGIDTVRSYFTFTLGATLDNLELQGAANLAGTGNETANILIGNSGNNKLSGLGGNDWLDGGAGNDSLAGGSGNDTYVVDNAADLITEAAAKGTDTVMAGYSYSLGVNLENLTLTGSDHLSATGNTVANVLTGNSGNNSLDGAAGADTMIGGFGDDSYYVDDGGDIATELSGQGTDTVFASVTYTLGASSYIDILTLTGSSAINGTGNGAANTLNGNSGANLLDGAGGNDILTGGGGNDTLTGGNGGDAFVFGLGSGQDVINDFHSSQNDTVNLHAYSNGVAYGGGITLTAQGGNTLIDLGGGNTILVMNIVPADNNFLSHIVW